MNNDAFKFSAKLEIKKRIKMFFIGLLILIGANLIHFYFGEYFEVDALNYLLYISFFLLGLDSALIWYRYKKNVYGTSIYEFLEVLNNNLPK